MRREETGDLGVGEGVEVDDTGHGIVELEGEDADEVVARGGETQIL